MKVLYLAHGRAGIECLRKLLFELGVSAANLFVLTYERAENDELIQLCMTESVACSTASIKDSETRDRLAEFGADVVVSMHFRELIPAAVFESTTFGGINLHPSLLPKYRGCFSGVWAIIHGETHTGVSFHYLNEKFDDGRIVLQSELVIADAETGHSIFNRLIDLGVNCFNDAFRLVVQDRFKGLEQVGEPTYFGRALPYNGVIGSEWSDSEVERFIRALNFPGLDGAQVETEDGLVAVNTMDEYQDLMVGK